MEDTEKVVLTEKTRIKDTNVVLYNGMQSKRFPREDGVKEGGYTIHHTNG